MTDFLDTRQLQAFVAVMSIGSMTGAAKALGRSQSVISRLIQDLEAELGFPLLHRNGPRFTPTQEGVAFFQQAELFLGGLRTIDERARLIAQEATPPMEIAAIAALASSLLPAALADLEKEGLPGHVHIHSTASENVVGAVVAGTADLGLASVPLENPGVEVHWLAEVPCVAVVADHHRLAGAECVTAADLRDERLIASANPFRLRMKINQALAAQGIQPARIIDCNATFVSVSLARQGLGVAIVEAATLSGMPVDGVRVLPLDFYIPFRWGIVGGVGRPRTASATRLIAALDRVAQRTLPGLRRLDPAAGD